MTSSSPVRIWFWVLFTAMEAFLYVSYQLNNGSFHWFLHFFVGASIVLIVMGLITALSDRIVRHPLLWIFVGHVIAMFPDILWNFSLATHQPWMDVFLGHIVAHFIPGRNWTWYGIFLMSLAFYLYQRAMKEAATIGVGQHQHVQQAQQKWLERVQAHRMNHRLAHALTTSVAVLSLSGCIHTAPFRDNQGRIVPGSIAVMETVAVGGIPQQVWFRGTDTRNPALLILHGGPGASEAALFRSFNSELERHFLVVNWEQRGTGRSFHTDIRPESMTIAQFLRDLDEVVDVIKKRFDKQHIVLLGHSWGSALGTIYAFQHPENVAAYVGIGQTASMPEGERLSYDYALTQAVARGNREALDALRKIGPPPHTVDDMLVSRHWVEHFGGSFHTDLSPSKLIWAALRTEEANLIDLILFGRGNRFSLEHLWPEFSQLDLMAYTSFKVPVFFLLGRYDRQVPSTLAASYFEIIEAPCKRLIWFVRSGHNPPFEEAETFNRVMIEDVLPMVTGSRTCVTSLEGPRNYG